ncbi:mitochondrial ribosomal protein L39 [Nomia melanderi]|uniref:mitochondrial ribosomal protein L39 n=1 Tax=Nomia melanderi TaxID=2448451 RepID=UPI001304004A|nr:39S ribosomal protein L39, mitochondrial [Nomia melanderi]
MFQRCRILSFNVLRLQKSSFQTTCQGTLSKTEIKEQKNLLFDKEKKRQQSAVGRIEKIEVTYVSPVEEITLVMNKCLSTPADCAKHISEGVVKVSALALVDGSPWDMHKPLTSNCKLELLSLLSPKVNAVNVAFWRTCSFLLGAVIDSSFKDEVKVHLHSFPIPIIKAGSFVYDVYIELPDWRPIKEEMQALSAQFIKFVNQELPLERLETTEDVAMEIFQDNPIKFEQIPNIVRANDGKIVLYRVGDHIDISKGPMVGNSNLIGRCTITAVHKISETDNVYRFQGIALPKGILLNHYAFGILEKRARKLNQTTWIHQSMEDKMESPLKMVSSN